MTLHKNIQSPREPRGTKLIFKKNVKIKKSNLYSRNSNLYPSWKFTFKRSVKQNMFTACQPRLVLIFLSPAEISL